MRTVGIIDYGLCNIDSIRRATDLLGGIPTVTQDPDSLRHFDLLILPGVGSFGAAMANLNRDGLATAAQESVAKGVPLLGICLGMQLLGDSSTEGGDFQGLSLISGDVVELVSASHEDRIPHMGWNSIEVTRDDPILKGISSGTDFYFVHSFHLQACEQDIIARTPYCSGFVSMVRHDQVWGTQFHPEKSWPSGHTLLSNFIETA